MSNISAVQMDIDHMRVQFWHDCVEIDAKQIFLKQAL